MQKIAFGDPSSSRYCDSSSRILGAFFRRAVAVAELDDRQGSPNPAGCPFQLDGLCSVHTIRPFGCRVFFCDETATDWQHEQYERFHSQIKRLHEQFDVPYVYIEWRAALRELGLSTLPATGKPADDRGPLSLPQLRL